MEIFEKTKEIFDKKLMEEKLNEAVENLTKN